MTIEEVAATPNIEFTSAGIPFTQYLRPHGTPIKQWITLGEGLTEDHNARAKEIVEAGFHFTAEHLANGRCVFIISDGTYDLAVTIADNGPDVPCRVAALIQRNTVERLKARRKRYEEADNVA